MNKIKIVDPEYECKALTYGDVIRKACELIPDVGLREICYLTTNNDRILFIDANTLNLLSKEDFKIYDELFCFHTTQEIYAIMIIPATSTHGKGFEYILITKIYGNMVEWRAALLKYSPSTYVIIKKEGTRRILRDELEKIVEKIAEISPTIKIPVRHYAVSSLYK